MNNAPRKAAKDISRVKLDLLRTQAQLDEGAFVRRVFVLCYINFFKKNRVFDAGYIFKGTVLLA